MCAVAPEAEPACGLQARRARVKGPELLACRGIQREEFLCGREAVKHAPDDERIGLQTARFAGIVGPRKFELLHVAAIKLLERRVAIIGCGAAVRRPVRTLALAELRVTRSLSGPRRPREGDAREQGRKQERAADQPTPTSSAPAPVRHTSPYA